MSEEISERVSERESCSWGPLRGVLGMRSDVSRHLSGPFSERHLPLRASGPVVPHRITPFSPSSITMVLLSGPL